ncbi:hypothetical protein YDYSY3_38720 [Paenibacillus chitinolyticus]|uniref:hypothetical protein n=1 Tax=Paenibacillus chitinolyticus TaxID=79263 RepID=UPI0026E4FC48|nr:hypothetical protein [Paenibacillus chitinolyticus]GKS12872.1 hypothetical protein YDYSY3_38720 [Paenibacillus chitinolyticus]
MEHNYADVMTFIKQPFPEGTVKFRSDNNRPYIPNQVYTDRLEQATGSRWDLEIKELEINVPSHFVKAIVRIHIAGHYRDGYGFSPLDGDARKVTNAVDQAVNEAFLTAVDSFEMGWKDLAPFKQNDWGGNPALRHLLEEAPPSQSPITQPSYAKISHKCIKCGENLTNAEWELLGNVPNLNRSVMIFCFDHLPEHMKRRLPDDVVTEFEQNRKRYDF